jgi:hypothetical protein
LILWGGEIHNYYLKKSNTLYDKLIFLLSKYLIRNAFGIIGMVPQEYQYIKDRFKTKAIHFTAAYPLVVNFIDVDKNIINKNINKEKIILLGNSASETNNHFEIIDKFSDVDLNIDYKIKCPLSYGDKEYAKQVIEFAKDKLGDRFVPLTEWMEPDDYAKLINGVDIAIMNHKRQQAFGNIIALLYAGKKVYIRNTITIYKFLESIGIKVYDTEELVKSDIDKKVFNHNKKDGIRNRQIIEKYFSEEHLVELWNDFFNSKR